MVLKKNYLLVSAKFVNDIYPNPICSFFIKTQKKNKNFSIITIIVNILIITYVVNLCASLIYLLMKLSLFILFLMIIKSFVK